MKRPVEDCSEWAKELLENNFAFVGHRRRYLLDARIERLATY